MFLVMRDDEVVAGPFSTYDAGWLWIFHHQGQSVEYALTHGGYSIFREE